MTALPEREAWQAYVEQINREAGKPLDEKKVRRRAVKQAARAGYSAKKSELKASFDSLITVQRSLPGEGAGAEQPQIAGSRKKAGKRALEAAPPAAQEIEQHDSQPEQSTPAKPSNEGPLLTSPDHQGGSKPRKKRRVSAGEEKQQDPAVCTPTNTAQTPAVDGSIPKQAEASGRTKSRKKKEGRGRASLVEEPAPGLAMPAIPGSATPPQLDAMPAIPKERSKKKKRASKAVSAEQDEPFGLPAIPESITQGNSPLSSTPASRGVDPAATPVSGSAAKKTTAKRKRKQGEAGTAGAPKHKWTEEARRSDLKTGRYTNSEKKKLREGIQEYATMKGLDPTNLDWVFHTKTNVDKEKSGGMWRWLADNVLTHRSARSVVAAGTRLLHEGNYQGKWSLEDTARLLELVEQRGKDWKSIGPLLGRMPFACRDRWKEARLGAKLNRGKWSAQEVERLKHAVEEYREQRKEAEGEAAQEAELSAAHLLPEQSGGSGEVRDARMVLDDINWFVISDRVGTRSNNQCMKKWYNEVSPSMVARGEWGMGEDRTMLRALFKQGCNVESDVDWGSLVPGRSERQAVRRWRVMCKLVPNPLDKDFPDKVEYLVNRYLPGTKQRQQQARAAREHETTADGDAREETSAQGDDSEDE